MLGDLRVLDLGDELLLDTERVGAAGAVQHDPALQARAATSSCTSARSSARCCRWSGPARATCSRSARPSTTTRATRSAAASAPSRPTWASTSSATPERAGEVKAALGVPEVDEAVAEIVRVEHGRPRYGIDLDDSVIPQEAGLNERAVYFRRAATSGRRRSRACSTAASRTATCAGCGSPSRWRPASRCGWASARSAASAPPSSPPPTARSPWRWCGARRRPATR